MPFIPGTPESLIQRSDSKNPASTCRGLTSNGQPCRRSISKSPNVSPRPSPRRVSSPEAFCWQHKNQVIAQGGASPQGIQSATIRERTSVDTLIDRLGLLEVEERKKERKRKPVSRPQPDWENSRYDESPSRRNTYRPRPEPEKSRPQIEHTSSRPERHRPRPQQESNLLLLCCFGTADDRNQAPRPVPRPNHERKTASIPVPPQATLNPHLTHLPLRPIINRDPSSRTGELLALIPKTASPQTTALLLAELAKPVSELDSEGFIYMFWLTPESIPAPPPSDTASSLLAPPSRPEPGRRRTSDVLNTFATTLPNKTGNKKTITLKIGRAQNVQRRLNQWTRQCGYDLSLIRYYPYHPTLSETNVNELPRTPRKVPFAHKVERLIHIELNGQRAQGSGKCKACGKEHREWFEVDASRDGVRAVDEVIRRWVDWGERDAR